MSEAVDRQFELQDVHYHYHDVAALRGITLSISAGERIALLGANGSGKSTLLRILDALYFPTSGRVAFDGKELIEERFREDAFAFDFRRRVGLVFQNPDVQLFNPTVVDELAFGPLQLRWPKGQIRERIEECLDAFGIRHLRDRPPHRLSGGEKKRVAIASVLILDPAVLLLDEPTSALDPRAQSQMIDFLTESRGRTVITATHDLGIVEDIATRCVVLEDGQVAADGAPATIVQDHTLLRRTGLLHEHRHLHPDGSLHSHPHLHGHHQH